jgi:hypothetical protein
MSERPRPRWVEYVSAPFGIPRHRWFLFFSVWCWTFTLRHIVEGAFSAGTPAFVWDIIWGAFQFVSAMVATALAIWTWPTLEEKAETSARRLAKRAERRARRTTPPNT